MSSITVSSYEKLSSGQETDNIRAMSKKTIILLCIFVFSVIGFAYVHYRYSKTPLFFSRTQIPLSPTIDPQTTLSFSPSIITAVPMRTTTTTVIFDTQGAPPNLIQLEIAYDPNVLTNVSIQPENFFPSYNVTLNTINPRIGRISYAVEPASNTIPEKKTGNIATITFTPILQTWQKETTLSFMPKTMVQIKGNIHPLKATYGAKILISPLATSSAIIQ